MGFFDSIFGGGGGGGNTVGNILGALQTGAQMYNTYQTGQDNKQQQQTGNALAQAKFDEERRQFDLSHQLALAKLGMGGGGGGGGGGGPDPRQLKSSAMQNAYQFIADTTLQGRSAEAAALSKIVDQLQRIPQLASR